MRQGRHRRISIAARVGVVAALSSPVCTFAEQPGDNPVVVSYSQMHQVSIAEAARRLDRMREAGSLGQRIQQENPDTFGGLYIEHHPIFRIVVKFTKNAKEQLDRYTNDPLFVAETTPRSLVLLRSVQEELGDQLIKSGTRFESGLDLKSSEINVSALDPSSVSQKISGLTKVANFIKIHKTTGFMKTTAIAGGNKLMGTTRNCTSGFNVVDPVRRELGVVTAGHCNNDLTYTNPYVTLVFQSPEYDAGPYDIQWHKQRAGSTPQQQVNEIHIGGSSPSTLMITSETPSSSLAVGTTVCKSGITTNYTCGEISDMDAFTDYNGQIGSYIRVHNANNNLMTDEGDSGGPVFGTNSAYGIVHGRGAPGTPTGNDLYFMPIERLSVLGVSVLMTPFDIDTIPNVSGPYGAYHPIKVNFKGTPKFPVEATTEVVPGTCPPDATCPSPARWVFPDNIPSPLSFNYPCYPRTDNPPMTIRLRTTLKDASELYTRTVEHLFTCTTP